MRVTWRGVGPCVLGLLVAAASDVRAQTLVSLTFDDSPSAQRQVKELLAPTGLKATFFIITGRVGVEKSSLSLADLRELAAAGHEIGSHTVTHQKLSEVASLEERRAELCESRAQLRAWGFPAVSFAYPLSGNDAATEQLVEACGYESGRDANGLNTCAGCTPVETLPPRNRFAIRTAPTVLATHTVADLQGWVEAAERTGGGWLPLVFHKIADPATCGTNLYCFSPENLQAFVQWLAQRKDRGTLVKTVHEVMGGGAPTPVLLPNPSFEEDADGDGAPDCWQEARTGDATSTSARVGEAHAGVWGHQLSLTRVTQGGHLLAVAQAPEGCAPAALPNHRYRLTFWYRSDVGARPLLSVRRANGTWTEWTAGPHLAPASTWTQATWEVPAVPADGMALSVGVRLEQQGRLEVDDFALFDTGVPSGSALLVLSPNGGEVLQSNSRVEVSWQTQGEVPRVDVSWSADDGASWQTVAMDVENACSLLWRVPAHPTASARLRVASASDGSVADQSDVSFHIARLPGSSALEPDAGPPSGTPPGAGGGGAPEGGGLPSTGCGCTQTTGLSALTLLLLLLWQSRRRRAWARVSWRAPGRRSRTQASTRRRPPGR